MEDFNNQNRFEGEEIPATEIEVSEPQAETSQPENEVQPQSEENDGTTPLEYAEAAEANAAEPLNSGEQNADYKEGAPYTQPQPIYNKVTYTDVKPIKDYKPMSRGLKIFSVAVAFILLLTGSCLTGYFLGKNGTGASKVKPSITFEQKPSDKKALAAAEIYDSVQKSVVGIVAYNADGNASQACGIIISKDGYIVTNDHIYAEIPTAKFKIFDYDGKEYDAQFVAGDKISDLAVLKIKSGEFTSAEFADSDKIAVGQDVYAIGRPDDAFVASGISNGIISYTGRYLRTATSYSEKLIETTCAVNFGSSGGALVNSYGQVIGVTVSVTVDENGTNVGYAIPSAKVKWIVDELIAKGKVVSRAKLGITYNLIDPVTADLKNLDCTGLYLASVSEDSGLYGKAKEGDIITEINSKKVTDESAVLDVIGNSRAGDTISVTVLSGDKTATYDVKLTSNPSESSYTNEKIPSGDSSGNGSQGGSQSGGIFDFPDGE